jgi:hypothetical protein
MRSRIIRAIAAGLLIGTLLVAGAAPLAPPGTRFAPISLGR